MTFDHITGNEWWVEVRLSGEYADNSFLRVSAHDDGQGWVSLEKKSWGVWAASFHIEPGHRVQFQAIIMGSTSDAMRWTSCWFTHTAGVEQCATPPPPPPVSTWQAKDIGNAGAGAYSGDMAVGDADNDGAREVYSATEQGVYQFKWTGSSWTSQRLGTSHSIIALAVGDGNGDGLSEVYALMSNGNVVRYSWWSSAWSEDTLFTLPGPFYGADMTLGNIDGVAAYPEIYVGVHDGTTAAIYHVRFTGGEHFGGYWATQQIGALPGNLESLWVGDGDRDGLFELYVGHGNDDQSQSDNAAGISRLRFISGSWDFTTIDFTRSPLGEQYVVAGDGDRDGKAEVYSVTDGGEVRRVTFDPAAGWIGQTLMMLPAGSAPGAGPSGLFLGDGDGDGSQELYIPTQWGQLFQVRWIGTTWVATEVARPTDYNGNTGETTMVVVGDGDNVGGPEAYLSVPFNTGLSNDPGHTQVYQVVAPRSSGFGATFTMVQGNVWWEQAQVTPSGEVLSKVDVSLNGGAWQPLKLQTWGVREYAGSYHAVQGTIVQLRATSTTGAIALSACYQWIPASGQDATQVACGSTPPPPPPPSGFDATFTGVKGNDWWVQTNVAANQPVAGVDVRVNCAPSWKPLTKQSWGGWTASFNIPAGSKVDFAARSTSGAADASGGYTWPQATATSGCALGVWPQQGSFSTYNIHHAMGGGGETFVTDARLNLAYNNGAWTGICTGRSTHFGNEGETSTDWTATVNGKPPLKLPAATSVGATHNLAYFFPSYDGHTCDLRTSSGFPATVQRQEDRVTSMQDSNGAPITLRAWVSDDPAEGRYAAAWDTKLGLVLDWNRYGPGGYGGDLVATDAPVR